MPEREFIKEQIKIALNQLTYRVDTKKSTWVEWRKCWEIQKALNNLDTLIRAEISALVSLAKVYDNEPPIELRDRIKPQSRYANVNELRNRVHKLSKRIEQQMSYENEEI